MSGYVKVFEEIVRSTIWREPDETRLVWITMLAIADRHGEVRSSLPGLADTARVSLDACREALKVLSAPDEYSRSQEFQGRRIEECDGGWRILNYEKYRNRFSREERNEYHRVYQKDYRKRAKEAPAKAARAKAIMSGKGTMAERLAVQAAKEGDQETLRRLEEMQEKVINGPEKAFREKVQAAMEAAAAEEAAAKASRPVPVEEGAVLEGGEPGVETVPPDEADAATGEIERETFPEV